MAFAIATHALAAHNFSSATQQPLAPSASSSSSSRIKTNARMIRNHPDSDIIPSVIYDALSTERSRGRSTERKIIHSSSPSPPATRRGSASSNTSTSDVDAHTVTAHHSLPPTTDEIATDPILYLPPLLSPLPESHIHRHNEAPAQGTTEEKDETTKVLIKVVEALKGFETRLPDIDPASLALHQALHHFKPWDEDYASTPYDEAFNWSSLSLPKGVEREWYCVVFRSRRKPESSNLSLYRADREAHEEAVKNGGLVMYWYGVPDHTGLNLATCIWQSRRHAIKAISGPKHMKAMKETEGAYETYQLERWILSKKAGKRHLELKKWVSGDVGW
ncbi:uncharacterized protein I303_104233 [Kwoniella dejecticola CBS 10117]|uniref:Uncharacterized protein n=1 Tax=Kwoniella dejecticola CBS 10117 TaxID=1296121 RepID=A0A1A6A5X4_9TREE|nr:uncharacterized protein I303_04790 [Kwoniella dejecticola CBS 10117]OBR85454.1 hypothetical protein I303_04790 [Kwoniella dejecticola CBS 10117]